MLSKVFGISPVAFMTKCGVTEYKELLSPEDRKKVSIEIHFRATGYKSFVGRPGEPRPRATHHEQMLSWRGPCDVQLAVAHGAQKPQEFFVQLSLATRPLMA